MDEGPQLRQQFANRKKSSTPPPAESIDERVTPSLVVRSMGKQQPVIFGDFVLTAFTRWFGLNRYRVHVPWTAYIAQEVGKSRAFDAAIFSVNSVFMGHSHYDDKLQRASREVYCKALRLLADQMRDEAAMISRESVSITIALSLFEAYSRTNPDSWAHHAGGTALLMARRGPAAHLTGFDRCLYLSFRSFLVAEAFVNGKQCLFEQPEWQAHIDQVRVEDMVSPRVDAAIALFIDLQDRIFAEVVKVPGMLCQARSLCASPDPENATQALAAQTLHCTQTIDSLAAHLRVAATAQNSSQWCSSNPEKNEVGNRSTHFTTKTKFIGPVPSTFPQEFANSVLRGADKCLVILRLLLTFLDSEKAASRPGPGGTNTGTAGAAAGANGFDSGDGDGDGNPNDQQEDYNPEKKEDTSIELPDPLPFRIISKLDGQLSADKWLDHVAASMGLEAFDIITCPTKTSPPSLPIPLPPRSSPLAGRRADTLQGQWDESLSLW